jgi:hypothetical protein
MSPPLAPPPVPTSLVITPLQVSQPSRVKLGIPSHFDGDRVQGCTFLTSCELYISLTQLDFIDKQVHWYAIGTVSMCRPKQADSFWHISAELGKKMMTSHIQKDDNSPHMQSQWHSTLHSNASNCCNAWWSQSVPSTTISTLVSYDTYLPLIIFKIIPHPMTLLTAFPLQVIILYLI